MHFTLVFILSCILSLVSFNNFIDCSLEDYYAGVQYWSQEELAFLVTRTHRSVLPYTSSTEEDVWDALIDLDGENGLISLVYSSHTFPETSHGTADTWNRKHLWPVSLGIDEDGPDYTDIHHIRPADWNVNSACGNKYFGNCGIFDVITDCRQPAHMEAAADTEADGVIFTPSFAERGDIARAIFYMDLRYSHLTLSDCPDMLTNAMAYRSILLKWHQEDPPTDTERQRNDGVACRWQGNRNVFVDYPELVLDLYGEPREPSNYCDEDVAIEPAPTSTSVGTIDTNPPVASPNSGTPAVSTIEPAPTSISVGTIDTNPPVASPNSGTLAVSTNDSPTPAASPTSGMISGLTNDTSTSDMFHRRSIIPSFLILITIVAMK
jgi:endonuclease I